jgi:nicotinamide-nucleotide amidase
MLRHSSPDLSAAITGVAGPKPDEDENPVRNVCVAVARRGGETREFIPDYGQIDRDAIRRCAVADTLVALVELTSEAPPPP